MKKQFLLIVLLLGSILTIFFILQRNRTPAELPTYYPVGTEKRTENGKEITDTIYHVIPPFRFINQAGDTVTDTIFRNKVFVADFFFSSCPSICPMMMKQMTRVRDAMENKPDFKIISHSVNPEHDSVPVLNAYAHKYQADPAVWMFVTGNKKHIYDIAMDGYKLPLSEDPREPGGFLHSDFFVLVDTNKHIRGYYHGTDSLEVDRLIKDIKILSFEKH